MSKFNSFLLYFFGVGTKFRFLSLCPYLKGQSYIYQTASLNARLILIVLPWFVERRLRLLLIRCSCVFGFLVLRPPVRFSNSQFHFCYFHIVLFKNGDIYFHYGFVLIAASLFLGFKFLHLFSIFNFHLFSLLSFFFQFLHLSKTENEVVNPSKQKIFKRFTEDIINRRSKH